MALERVPADIRAEGGVARMSDPQMINEIMETVTIPVMAKARIGHFVECQVSVSSSRLQYIQVHIGNTLITHPSDTRGPRCRLH